MTNEFSRAVDPIFLEVLDLLSRIQKQDHGDPEAEQTRILTQLEKADHLLGQADPDWSLAKYAIVGWVDEVLTKAAWSGQGREWWQNNPLEIRVFRMREAALDFFRRARTAASSRSRNALEVFYVCVMLGFRGVYDPEVALNFRVDDDLPSDLGKWARNVAAGIQTGLGRPPITESPQEGEGTPALRGKYQLIGALFCMATLLVIGIFVVNRNSDVIDWLLRSPGS